MGKILSIIASIAIVLVFVYAFTKKPPVILDANGFPSNPKQGDKYVKNGVSYTFVGSSWVITLDLPDETNTERSTCPDWLGKFAIMSIPGEIGFENTLADCPRCIKHKGTVYSQFLGNHGFNNRCYFKA